MQVRAPSREAGASIKSNKFAVRTGSVLLSRLNPLHAPRVDAHLDHQRLAICSTEFLVPKPRPPVTIEYLYGLLQSNDFAERMASRVDGHLRKPPAGEIRPSALAIPGARPPSGLMGRDSDPDEPAPGAGSSAHRGEWCADEAARRAPAKAAFRPDCTCRTVQAVRQASCMRAPAFGFDRLTYHFAAFVIVFWP